VRVYSSGVLAASAGGHDVIWSTTPDDTIVSAHRFLTETGAETLLDLSVHDGRLAPMAPEETSPSPQDALAWVRELQGTGAAGIADLAGYNDDFSRARDACLRIIALSAPGQSDDALVDLLWISAVISYARPFGKDRRQQFPDSFLDGLSAEAKATHLEIRTIRDKYIAHSENSMETNLPVCELTDPSTGHREVARVGVLALRRRLDPLDAVRLIQLVKEVSNALTALTQVFRQEILSQLQTMAIEDLYAEPSVLETRIERGESTSLKRPRARDRQPSTPITLA